MTIPEHFAFASDSTGYDHALNQLKTEVWDPQGLSDSDAVLLPVHHSRDIFRLSIVDELLTRPFSLVKKNNTIKQAVYPEHHPQSEKNGKTACPLPLNQLWSLLDVSSDDTTEFEFQSAEDVFESFLYTEKVLQEFLSVLDQGEREYLREHVSYSFLMEEEDTTLNPWQLEKQRLRSVTVLDSIYKLAGRLNLTLLAKAANRAHALEAFLIKKLSNGKRSEKFMDELTGYSSAYTNVPIKLGSDDGDNHLIGRGIYLDLAGNDHYQFLPQSFTGGFTLLIDVEGDDFYKEGDTLHSGISNMGIMLQADLSGDDVRQGQNFSTASALFGVSRVFDARGDDSYSGICASQGFAFFGIGILDDASGNDTYSASLFSQAASSTKGLGVLLDRKGNDFYLARQQFTDDLRYTDHSLNMMQGFSSGMRPDYSGGIGFLWDIEGRDSYQADIYGQGSGYWFALGLLIDDGGNDSYRAFQYAQGAGVHLAIGALMDAKGNDLYNGKGVSQGCGHDLALGVLLDAAGDDAYAAVDMSQGAGSANGIGLLSDPYGKDMYAGRNSQMVLGHADMRRDKGSFGLFFDGEEIDLYFTPFGNNTGWSTFGRDHRGNGFGLDQ